MKLVKGAEKRQHMAIALLICVGIILSTVSFTAMRKWEFLSIEKDLEQSINNKVYAIQKELENNSAALQSIVSLFNSSQFVERKEFQSFAKHILSHSKGMKSLQWVKRVPMSEKKDFEVFAQKNGFPDFRIHYKSGLNISLTDEPEKEFFPVYYIAPENGNEHKLGFDLSSYPYLADLFNKSCSSGKMVIASGADLPEHKNNLFIYLPVYNRSVSLNTVEERWKNLKGFVVGEFIIEEIIGKILKEMNGNSISVAIYNVSDYPQRKLLYSNVSSWKQAQEQQTKAKKISRKRVISFSHKFNLGNYKLLIISKPMPELIEKKKTRIPWIFFVSGIFLTIFIVVYLVKEARHSNQVVELVNKLSDEAAERKKTETALQKELEINTVLADLSAKLISCDSIDDISYLIEEFALKITESEVACAGYIECDTGNIVYSTINKYVDGRCHFSDKGDFFKKLDRLWGWSMKDRQAVMENNPASTMKSSGIPAEQIPIKRFLSVPASLGDRPVGQIALANAEHDYTESDLNIVERLAVLYALAIERDLARQAMKKAYDELEERVQRRTEALKRSNEKLRREVIERKQAQLILQLREHELSIRNKIANIFLTAKEENIYGEVLDLILEVMESKYGIFAYIDEHGAMVCPSMTRHVWHRCQMPDKTIVFPRGKWSGIWGKALNDKKSYLANDGLNVPEGHIPITKTLCVPVVHHGESIGIIMVANKNTDYDEADQNYLEAIVNYIAPVLNAILERDRQERERKAAEEENQKMQAQLLHMQKMEAIGTLAGGIAHDFNNILMVIFGYTQLSMYSVQKDTELHSYLQEIMSAGNRAKDLVEQILAFSRQETQEFRPLQVHLIVKEALKLLRASLPSTIEISCSIETFSNIILADATQIHQVIMNLCVNAAHAMEYTGGTLKVSLKNVTLNEHDIAGHSYVTPGTYILLTVKDSGCGMDKATMERIFEPFFTTKKRGKGTGMGLSVVHGIVKSHRGMIEMDSEPGKGSTFKVFLPRYSGDTIIDQIDKSDILPEGNENILFVDDEKAIVSIAEQMLKRLGYNVVTKTSSIDALRTLVAQPDRFDLVITDQTMPNLTGIELAKSIILIRPDTPIILTTGHSESITVEKAMSMGISEMIMKPIDDITFAETIRHVLGAKKKQTAFNIQNESILNYPK